MISAKIIADSIANGTRLTTMELCYHRFIHSEFMTHRMFSKNAASSRAIPIEKMIKQVEENPAMPIHWGRNQPGMQADEELDSEKGKLIWLSSRNRTLDYVKQLNAAGYHKQVVNRLLEPFQYIKVIVTATEWDNFFNLRLHGDAQPEIQELARCMKKAMQLSEPTLLVAGEWHLPYVDKQEFYSEEFEESDYLPVGNVSEDQKAILTSEMAIKCSVARCARVSYNNHDNSQPDIQKDLILADKLLTARHMVPMEHQATPMPERKHEKYTIKWVKGITHRDRYGNYWSGNFKNWIQYRQLVD